MQKPEFKCSDCGLCFSKQFNLQRHQQKCDGFLPLQCRSCGKLFKTKQDKYKHSLKRGCSTQASTNVQVTTNTGTVNVSNVIDNSVNTVNVNVDGDVVCQAMKKYFQTNLEKVIEDLLENPAFIQMAFKNKQLHQAIVEKTHYGNVRENKNVLGVDKNGRDMYVLEDGKRLAISKKVGLHQSVKNATSIANSPEIQPLLTKFPELPIKQSTNVCEQRSVILDHYYVHYNKGEFAKRFTIPDYRPPVISIEEWESILFEILPNVVSVYRQPLDIYKDLVLKSCAGFVILEDTWFAACGSSGWIVCDDEAVVISKMHIHLNGMKALAKCNLLKKLEVSPQPELQHYVNVMTHFPDRDLASKSVEWMLEIYNDA